LRQVREEGCVLEYEFLDTLLVEAVCLVVRDWLLLVQKSEWEETSVVDIGVLVTFSSAVLKDDASLQDFGLLLIELLSLKKPS